MRSIQPEIEQTFYNALKNQLHGRDRPLKITVAFSGGPDSTLLLYLLNKFKDVFDYVLDAAHVSHGIRSQIEMKDEEECVRKTAGDLNISLHEKRMAPGFLEFYSGRTHCGMESAARIYRYRFFDKILSRSENPGILALGHNRNDQEETILMRLFTGSGIEGLRGIPEASGSLIRPLISISRDRIISYLESLNLNYVHDNSNFEQVYLRNRVRLVLSGQIRDIFPDYGSSILRLGEDAGALLDHYHKVLEKECPWESDGVGYSCRADDFLAMPYVSRRGIVLRRMNSMLRGSDAEDRISRHFFLPLKKDDYKEGTLLKGHGILLFRQCDRLFLRKDTHADSCDHVYFHLNSSHPFSAQDFSLNILPVSDGMPEWEVLFFLQEESVIVRTPDSMAEKRRLGLNSDAGNYIVQSGNHIHSILDSQGRQLIPGMTDQKRSEFDSKYKYQCVIIRGRGEYAPG